jgi:hypothetical protein
LNSAPTKTIGSATAVSETLTPNIATSHPVPVVPMFAPKTKLKPCGNVSSPALTSPMVVMVVALDDCTSSVMTAPQNVPRSDVAAAFVSTRRKAEPATALRPSVITAMPSKKRPTPPRIEVILSKGVPPTGALFHKIQRSPLYVLIAGGVGISPMESMIRTLADRGDEQPVMLYSSKDSVKNWKR